jgi:hypothetical protein
MRDPRLKSKWWRLTHLYKIKDKQGRLVKFKPNYVQLAIIVLLAKFKRLQILKYRQGGITTLMCIYNLDDAIWTPGFTAAIISHDGKHLDTIFQIVELAFDNMPASVKPKTRQDTLRMLRFEESFDGRPLNSGIYVALKLRGGTVQAMHVSERAFIEGSNSTELEAGSKQAVAIDGRITEETTANGYNEFESTFTENFNNPDPGPYDTKAIFFAWHEHPEYALPGPPIEEYSVSQLELKDKVRKAYNKELTDDQVYWYDWKRKDLIKSARSSDDSISMSGDQLMKQEYPSTIDEAFQSGAGSVFDQDKLANIILAMPKVYMSKTVQGQRVNVWHEFERGKKYAIGVDPSDGTGSDEFGLSIWDENYTQCAQATGQLRPDKIADLAVELAEMYGEALLGVENNMLSTILFVSQKYKNYFSTVKLDERRQIRTKKMGWTTTQKSRDLMIDDFVMHSEEDTLIVNSARTLSEMRTFVVKEGGKREHAEGKKDDALFGDMIAIQMIKYLNKRAGKAKAFANKPQGF